MDQISGRPDAGWSNAHRPRVPSEVAGGEIAASWRSPTPGRRRPPPKQSSFAQGPRPRNIGKGQATAATWRCTVGWLGWRRSSAWRREPGGVRVQATDDPAGRTFRLAHLLSPRRRRRVGELWLPPPRKRRGGASPCAWAVAAGPRHRRTGAWASWATARQGRRIKSLTVPMTSVAGACASRWTTNLGGSMPHGRLTRRRSSAVTGHLLREPAARAEANIGESGPSPRGRTQGQQP